MDGWFKRIWLIAVLAAGIAIVILVMGPLREQWAQYDIHSIAEWLRTLGIGAVLIGGGLIVLQTFLPVFPFIALVAANVLVFGLAGGFLINWISSVVASILMFYVARTTGREWAQRKLRDQPKWTRLNEFLERNGFKTILALRLFPVIPPVALNLISGISTVGSRAYIIATTLGKMPAIMVQSMLGNDLIYFSDNKLRFLLLLAGFALFLFIGMKVVRKKMKLS